MKTVKVMKPFWENMMTMETSLGEVYSGPKGLYSTTVPSCIEVQLRRAGFVESQP